MDRNASAPSSVEIRVTEWTSARNETSVMEALLTAGSPGLLAAVRSVPAAGIITFQGSLPWRLSIALQQRRADGRRSIPILTVRPIGTWEVLLGSPSLEYPFSVIELSSDENRHGEGTLLAATRITVDADAGAIDIDSYGTVVRLVSVTRRHPTQVRRGGCWYFAVAPLHGS